MQIMLSRHLLILFLAINISIVNIAYSQGSFSPNLENSRQIDESPKSANNNLLQLSQINQNEECSVPCDEIFRIAVKDAVTSLDNPKFIAAGDVNAPDLGDKVLGIVVDGVARAYPYDILRWHEIVNDVIEGVYVSVTYTDLTASGIAYFTAELDNSELGYSGHIYQNNLVFYDRISDSQFSQMGNIGLRGEKIGTSLQTPYTIETTMEAWQQLYPNTLVLSRDTGMYYDYDAFPYGYFHIGDTIFYETNFDNQIFPYSLYKEKSLTHVVKINNNVRLMPFPEIATTSYINHNINDKNVFTIFSLSDFSAISYSGELNTGLSLTFTVYDDVDNLFDNSQTFGQPLFIDNEQQSIWNYKGVAISGSLEGSILDLLPTYNAYWYAASAYFPEADIYTVEGIIPSNITNSVVITPTTENQQFSITHVLIFIGILVVSVFSFPRIKSRFF